MRDWGGVSQSAYFVDFKLIKIKIGEYIIFSVGLSSS